MVAESVHKRRLDWRLPLYSTVAELFVLIFITFCPFDLAAFVSLLVVAPLLLIFSLVLVVLLSRAAVGYGRHQLLPILVTLAILWVVPTALLLYGGGHLRNIRDTTRWLLWSYRYKQDVLREPASPGGELKHIEWDGWGFPGAGDTTVYLVFDPKDSLAVAAKGEHPGKFNGIPCEVPFVHRLESQWYTVLFYTDQIWNRCD